jgi:hypothetical protein
MINQTLNRTDTNLHSQLSRQELDLAIVAAANVAKIVCVMKGDNSHDCLTAWQILAEMQSVTNCQPTD